MKVFTRMLQQGHSAQDGEAGEDLPLELQMMREYLDWKENNSTAARAAAGQRERQSVQRSLIGQQPPLGPGAAPLRGPQASNNNGFEEDPSNPFAGQSTDPVGGDATDDAAPPPPQDDDDGQTGNGDNTAAASSSGVATSTANTGAAASNATVGRRRRPPAPRQDRSTRQRTGSTGGNRTGSSGYNPRLPSSETIMGVNEVLNSFQLPMMASATVSVLSHHSPMHAIQNSIGRIRRSMDGATPNTRSHLQQDLRDRQMEQNIVRQLNQSFLNAQNSLNMGGNNNQVGGNTSEEEGTNNSE